MKKRKTQILLISSSPHREKSDTFILAKEVLRGACDNGCRGNIIHLADCHIAFCRHCQQCHKKILRCPLRDRVPSVLKAMLEAQGLIFASPNYISQITASMKALFERSTHFIHCKRLLGKYAAGVVSSGSGQDKCILEYIKHYANICGAQYSGGVFACEREIEGKLREAYRLGERLARHIKNEKLFPEQIKIVEASRKHFKKLIQLRGKEWTQEYRYWRNKGWL